MIAQERKAILATCVAFAGAMLVAWAGSQGGATWRGVPIQLLVVFMAFLIQWAAFIPAYLRQTEKFFDITGSLTYIAVAGLALWSSSQRDARSTILFGLIVVWALRLGFFLLHRVRRSGKDARFDEIKLSFPRFLMTWTLQGLWVSLTLAAALAAIASQRSQTIGTLFFLGLGVWLVGFILEVLADAQKSRFRSHPANQGRFVDSGLWRWSRHPNYFGEIVLWMGIAMIAAPVLKGWQWITLISPVFVWLLLTQISGIPMLEKRSDEKWGGEEAYALYKRRTSILIPMPPKRDRP